MRGLLLSAGLGTRLRPLTLTTPKCLVSIRGVPLLDHWLPMLLNGGIERTLINTHHLAELVRRHVRESAWKDRVDLVHETELLGTGGTILANRSYFGNRPFFIAHSDNLAWFDVGAFITRHNARPPQALITMMTFETDAPQSCGIVEEDANGLVIGFHEKVADPPGLLANGAVYVFEPIVLDFIASLGKRNVDISTELLPNFVGRICTFKNTHYHRDIGSIEGLDKANSEYSETFSTNALRQSKKLGTA
jgi:mannose-1-phosphate guanylyltransferase